MLNLSKPQAHPPGLDDIDLEILRALSLDARLTNKALANRLGIAESTCAYRVRMLRENGVITGSGVQLDLARLGRPIRRSSRCGWAATTLPTSTSCTPR